MEPSMCNPKQKPAHVIHAASVAVSREHRRVKTDRLDTEGLKRGFLGWLRGEREHCKMAAVPTSGEEDAKRPHREREILARRQESRELRTNIRRWRSLVQRAALDPQLPPSTCERCYTALLTRCA